MMSDIPPTLQDRLKPLFFQKDMYADKLCQTGKDIRRVQLELMKTAGASKETLLRSQRLIDGTRVGRGTQTTSAEAGTFRSLSGGGPSL